jgi:hypothetical protein
MSLKIHFNVVLPHRPWPSKRSLSPRFLRQKPFALLLSPICAVFLALLILLDFLTQMTVGEDISKIINISSLYNLLLSLFISPSQAEISSSTSCSQRTSVFAPSSV